jgi:hypothetical protein
MTTFDAEKALAVIADHPFAREFLARNRARLEELGTDLGQQALLEIIDLFAAGKNREAWRKFYGRDASWAALGAGAADDVTSTTAMAQRWADAGAFLRECGVLATKALLSIVVAGFCDQRIPGVAVAGTAAAP